MLCGYFHSGPETRAHLSDCVNEQYRGLRAIYVCNRHGWLRAVSEYNSGSVCRSLSWTSTEHRLRTAGFRLLYFFKFQKCCFYVYCSALRILNGRHPGGHANDFTFSSASGLSVIDYVLCSADMIECVQEFIISSFNEYSDHAPLHLVLDIRCYNNAVNRDHAGHGSVRKTCSWRPDCIDQCSKSLTHNNSPVHTWESKPFLM